MSIRQRISGIWLISMSLLALFAFTCYFVAQMWLSILRTAYITLVILQVAALTVYLWGPEKLKHRWQKILYRLLYASSFFVIPAFLFIFTGLMGLRIRDGRCLSVKQVAQHLFSIIELFFLGDACSFCFSRWQRHFRGRDIIFRWQRLTCDYRKRGVGIHPAGSQPET